MAPSKVSLLLFAFATPYVAALNPVEHVGANGQWYAGPNVNNISPDVPDGCTVDQAVYISRHGSRYPDPGAWTEWKTLYSKIQNASFTARDSLSFLKDWKPVLDHPDQDVAQISLTGYKELTNMGVDLRWRYPDFYTPNTEFTVWANKYQRTIDSARLFARGFMGPNATSFGRVVVVDSKAGGSASIGNSLATSDLCPKYTDSGSANATAAWAAIYLPPITKRLNQLVRGNLNLTDSDVSIMPYLCGFETQITGKKSPWCDVFTDYEILQYEYAQDLKYWYGTGLGSDVPKQLMLPVVQHVVDVLEGGPNKTYVNANGSSFAPGPLIVAFTHDNQMNELAAAVGVFDGQRDLSPERLQTDRLFHVSYFDTMKGTISFERLSCSKNGKYGQQQGASNYIRILLNDAVYPVNSCASGPGKSCALADYKKLIQKKSDQYGNWAVNCGVANATANTIAKSTFLTDLGLSWLSFVSP